MKDKFGFSHILESYGASSVIFYYFWLWFLKKLKKLAMVFRINGLCEKDSMSAFYLGFCVGNYLTGQIPIILVTYFYQYVPKVLL